MITYLQNKDKLYKTYERIVNFKDELNKNYSNFTAWKYVFINVISVKLEITLKKYKTVAIITT